MKMLPLMIALLAVTFCRADEIRKIVTLEDIEAFKTSPDDVFAESPNPDVERLKKLKVALSAAESLPKDLNQMLIEAALRDSIEDLRRDWEWAEIDRWEGPFLGSAYPKRDPKFELSASDARNAWKSSPWKHIDPTTKDGTKIDWEKVRKVTPMGVNLLTEGGFKWFKFDDLDYNFVAVFGWSEGLEEDALKARTKSDETAYRNTAANVNETLDNKAETISTRIPGSVSSRIKKAAESKWGEDFRMVKYEIEGQEKAFNDYLEYSKSTSSDMKTIVRNALSKWGDDYRMVVYEIKNQSEAKRKIDR